MSAKGFMLLEEDVVMNAEEMRLPPCEAPPLPSPCPPESQAADGMPPLPVSPPPMPWPRVFPSL